MVIQQLFFNQDMVVSKNYFVFWTLLPLMATNKMVEAMVSMYKFTSLNLFALTILILTTPSYPLLLLRLSNIL
jgi:hypothetical protein